MGSLARLTLTLTLAAATGGPAAASAACVDENLVPATENLERVRDALVCLHNEERHAAGAPPLTPQRRLERAARAHARDMASRRFFGHETPEGSDPFARLRQAGYINPRFEWNAGENIGWASGGLATPRSMMDGWLESYGRRITLLAREFDEIGVAIAPGAPTGAHAAGAATYVVTFGWRERIRSRSATRSCPKSAGRRSPRSAPRGRCRPR